MTISSLILYQKANDNANSGGRVCQYSVCCIFVCCIAIELDLGYEYLLHFNYRNLFGLVIAVCECKLSLLYLSSYFVQWRQLCRQEGEAGPLN